VSILFLFLYLERLIGMLFNSFPVFQIPKELTTLVWKWITETNLFYLTLVIQTFD